MKNIIYVCVLCLTACGKTIDTPIKKLPDTLASTIPNQCGRAEAIVNNLSIDNLAGQIIMQGIMGNKKLSKSSIRILKTVKPGAVLLFGHNISKNISDVSHFIDSLNKAAEIEGLLPFIAIDHEGGYVNRFKTGLTPLPSAVQLGQYGLEAAKLAGKIAGSELFALGITMNVAPVVESLNANNSPFLQDRAWSEDPAISGWLASSFINTCQNEGVATVAKHFPGNGQGDPHKELPHLNASFSELESIYLPPFIQAIDSNVSSIIMSHVLVASVDSKMPASLSANWINLLKENMGFNGIIMTDDMNMSAVKKIGKLTDLIIMALNAGIDMIMVSDEDQAILTQKTIIQAVAEQKLPISRLKDAATRIITQKLHFGLDNPANLNASIHNKYIMLDATIAKNTEALNKFIPNK